MKKLKIVLILAFNEFLNVNVFHDTQLRKCLLQHLKISYELVLRFGLGIDSIDGYFSWIKEVDKIAISNSRA